ncbi:hypothetical protein OS493_018058 [Desmophyllum pertusum]|uniref:C2H2-type domain-containing protein n=1 Tax=Desmophyllum pertusum TaxID=174260 RepID=A0A9W9YNH1_9CNID|nr:hypothetical protein OS493_018058 [Desmophyllum pertusum]
MPWGLDASSETEVMESMQTSNYARPCREAASAKLTVSTYSPTTPCVLRRSCNTDDTWTPSALPAFDDTMEMQEFAFTRENVEGPVQVFNACIDNLADALRKPRIDHLKSQVACWDNCSDAEISAVAQKAEEISRRRFHSSLLLLDSLQSKERNKADASEDKLYECPETSCTEEFQSQSDLDLHMNIFDHHTIPQLPVKESLYDKLKRDWVDHFHTLTLQGECLTGTAAAED